MIPARLDRARRDTYRAWQAAVKQFNKMPSALPYDSHATGEVVLPPKLLIGNDMINKAILKNATTLLRTEICLRAAPGQAPAVTSRKLSGVPRLDRLASAALTAAFPQEALPRGPAGLHRLLPLRRPLRPHPAHAVQRLCLHRPVQQLQVPAPGQAVPAAQGEPGADLLSAEGGGRQGQVTQAGSGLDLVQLMVLQDWPLLDVLASG